MLATCEFAVLSSSGAPMPGASARITDESTGALALLYSDRNGTTPIGNPTTVGDDSMLRFFAPGGAYHVVVDDGNGNTNELNYKAVGTNAESDFGNLYIPRGAYNAGTTYARGDIVSSSNGGDPYGFVCNANGTVGHAPTFSGTVGQSDTYWTVQGKMSYFPSAIDVNFAIAGKPSNGENVIGHTFTDAFTFPAGLTGSKGKAQTGATGSSVFTVRKNGANVGTATFAGAATVPTFAAAAPFSVVAGDVVDLVAPNPADATLAGISITLRGIR